MKTRRNVMGVPTRKRVESRRVRMPNGWNPIVIRAGGGATSRFTPTLGREGLDLVERVVRCSHGEPRTTLRTRDGPPERVKPCLLRRLQLDDGGDSKNPGLGMRQSLQVLLARRTCHADSRLCHTATTPVRFLLYASPRCVFTRPHDYKLQFRNKSCCNPR